MKRILLYCQNMRGTGHFVRMAQLARGLANRHAVFLLDGGRPISHLIPVDGISLLELPRICHCDGQILPFDSSAPLQQVMAARGERLKSICRDLRPDVMVVEHFPFSKTYLSDEILPATELVRQLNPHTRVIASARDLLPIVNETITGDARRDRVVQTLARSFDALLIHSDPRFISLADHLPWISTVPIPMHYTGYISSGQESGFAAGSPSAPVPEPHRSGVLVSMGGEDGSQLGRHCLEAWRLRHESAPPECRQMTICLPANCRETQLAELRRSAAGLPVRIERFSRDFQHLLRRSQLSISQAGYNTCCNLLATRTRAVLVPHPDSRDQPLRADRFADSSLATTLHPAELTARTLLDAIEHTLRLPPPQHDIDLNGVQRSCEMIDQLLSM